MMDQTRAGLRFLVSLSIIILCVIIISFVWIIMRRHRNFFEKLKIAEGGYKGDVRFINAGQKGNYTNFNKEDEI